MKARKPAPEEGGRERVIDWLTSKLLYSVALGGEKTPSDAQTLEEIDLLFKLFISTQSLGRHYTAGWKMYLIEWSQSLPLPMTEKTFMQRYALSDAFYVGESHRTVPDRFIFESVEKHPPILQFSAFLFVWSGCCSSGHRFPTLPSLSPVAVATRMPQACQINTR